MLVTEQRLHHRQSTPASAIAVPNVCRKACGCPAGTPAFTRWYRKMVRNPAGVRGWPRLAPLATTNNREHSVSGLSASR